MVQYTTNIEYTAIFVWKYQKIHVHFLLDFKMIGASNKLNKI